MTNDNDYRQLLDSLNTAVIVVDNHLILRYLNSAAEVIMDISLNRVVGKSLTAFFVENATAITALEKAAKRGDNYTKRRAHWRLLSGKKMIVDYTVTPLVDQSGLAIEVQPLDRLLRISREEALISAQETTRNLVKGLAHEIKNPLGGIRGAAQLLARQFPDAQIDEYTNIIIDESDRLRKLVDLMLGPHQASQWLHINIHELLSHIRTLIEAECAGEIDLKSDYDPSIPEFFGDREQLIQALLNIVRNAMQALQESGMSHKGCITLRTRIQRHLTIGLEHHALVCCVDVIDNGPGIPEELIKDVFYPMISGRAEGTGLGLAISQHLINLHQGLIECDSRPGFTKFSIFIPVALKKPAFSFTKSYQPMAPQLFKEPQ